MIYRDMDQQIEDFFSHNSREALLITGARQVGKTFSIRNYAKKHFPYVIEINFI